MAVTLQDVEHVALLARLSFTPGEKTQLTEQLNQILHFMDQLNSLDTAAVEPLAHVIDPGTMPRADEVRPGLSREDALRNAPSRTETLFKVPKVIGDR
jgi:aspartyl-tRNA(Asn)/glutamyl-tRNA(Gln) amidotransferase subunit C